MSELKCDTCRYAENTIKANIKCHNCQNNCNYRPEKTHKGLVFTIIYGAILLMMLYMALVGFFVLRWLPGG